MSEPDSPPDYRRLMVLLLGILFGACSFAAWWWGAGGSGNFATGAMGRIGLVFVALWLAWPSLQRPASWLPPGMAVGCVVLLAVLAARPRLVMVAVPVFLGLLTLSAIVRTINR